MLKNNYHTHMKYCNHATGDVVDYVKKADELGMEILGMSDHAPIPPNSMTLGEWDHNYCNENMTLEIFETYLNDIELASKQYKKLKLYKGLESEYLDGYDSWYIHLRKRLDYMILGVHFFKTPDNPKIYDTYSEINNKTVYEYYNAMERAVKTGLYDYLAHPDLFMFDYKDENGNYTFDENCIAITRKIFDLAIEYNLPVEINANGIKFAKGTPDMTKWRYPNLEFWRIAKDYPDLKIIIGADCHAPDLLDSVYIEYAKKMASELELPLIDKLDILKIKK